MTLVACSSPVAARRRSGGATCGAELVASLPGGQVQSPPGSCTGRASRTGRPCRGRRPSSRRPVPCRLSTSTRVMNAVVCRSEIVAVSGRGRDRGRPAVDERGSSPAWRSGSDPGSRIPTYIAQAAFDRPSRYQLEPQRSRKVGVFAPEASNAASLPLRSGLVRRVEDGPRIDPDLRQLGEEPHRVIGAARTASCRDRGCSCPSGRRRAGAHPPRR